MCYSSSLTFARLIVIDQIIILLCICSCDDTEVSLSPSLPPSLYLTCSLSFTCLALDLQYEQSQYSFVDLFNLWFPLLFCLYIYSSLSSILTRQVPTNWIRLSFVYLYTRYMDESFFSKKRSKQISSSIEICVVWPIRQWQQAEENKQVYREPFKARILHYTYLLYEACTRTYYTNKSD